PPHRSTLSLHDALPISTGAAHYRVINVGFKGDMAFAKWKAGDRAESLRLFSEVLTELETLPSPSKDIKTLTLEKRVGHTISWIRSEEHTSELQSRRDLV